MNPEEAFLRQCRKHVFILSSSGKPIFSRRGDESELVTTFGLLQAIVSIVDDSGDHIKVIRAGNRKIIYFTRKSLYFVTVSSTEEPDAVIYAMMEFMYNQILLMLTGKVHDMLRNNSSKDIRDLLGPETDRLLKITCNDDITHPSVAFHAVKSMYLAMNVRQDMNALLNNCVLQSGAALGIILVGNFLVGYKVNNTMSLSLGTADVLLLTHFVSNSSSLRSHDQNWVPICLPNFSANAYLQAYIAAMKFKPSPSGSATEASASAPIEMTLVLLTSESDPNKPGSFKDLHIERMELEEQLQLPRYPQGGPINQQHGIAQAICVEALQHSAKVSSFQQSKNCLHYLFKYQPIKTGDNEASSDGEAAPALPAQYIAGVFDETLQNSATQETIWTTYQRLYICSRLGSSTSDVISCDPAAMDASGGEKTSGSGGEEVSIVRLQPSSNHSLNYIVLTSGHVVVSLASADSELYVTFPGTMSPLEACGQCNYLSRYLRGNVENEFIIE